MRGELYILRFLVDLGIQRDGNQAMMFRIRRCAVPSHVVLLMVCAGLFPAQTSQAQCAGMAGTPLAAANCAERYTPQSKPVSLDPPQAYTLAELIDTAETHNPRTRIIWESAKQKAREVGVAKSAYYPQLAGLAVFGDERIINPFPKPLAPRGYTMAEIPLVQAGATLQYLIFDFGKRGATVAGAKAEKLAGGAEFIALNQQLAFAVASSYYKLLTAQERLQATTDTLSIPRRPRKTLRKRS